MRVNSRYRSETSFRYGFFFGSRLQPGTGTAEESDRKLGDEPGKDQATQIRGSS